MDNNAGNFRLRMPTRLWNIDQRPQVTIFLAHPLNLYLWRWICRVQVPPETPKYAKKFMLPLESAAADDNDVSAKVYLQPQAERSMEREMRAAREREIELREARGIPATTHDEARRSVSIEIEVITYILQ